MVTKPPSEDTSKGTTMISARQLADAQRTKTMRDLLQRAALDVASERGIRGVTYRRIADLADVSLGILNYHYDSIDGILLEAYSNWVGSKAAAYGERYDQVTDAHDLIAAMTNFIIAQHAEERDRVLLYELYAQSVRDPRYREIVKGWSASFRAPVARLCSPTTTRQLEAAWEGMLVQWAMSGVDDPVGECEAIFRLILSQEPQYGDVV